MQKGQKEKNTLLHDAERPKREKHASARCRKAKKRKNTLLHDAERPKREKTRFCTVQKGQKEEKHVSERLRKG